MQSLEEMSNQQQGINQGTMQLGQMGMMQQQSLLEQLMQQQQNASQTIPPEEGGEETPTEG